MPESEQQLAAQKEAQEYAAEVSRSYNEILATKDSQERRKKWGEFRKKFPVIFVKATPETDRCLQMLGYFRSTKVDLTFQEGQESKGDYVFFVIENKGDNTFLLFQNPELTSGPEVLGIDNFADVEKVEVSSSELVEMLEFSPPIAEKTPEGTFRLRERAKVKMGVPSSLFDKFF